MSKVYQFHPLADLFPMFNPADLKELAADIKANGQQVPIVLLEDRGEMKVLDGRNRMKACEKLGIDPVTITFDELQRTVIAPNTKPVDYVISLNLKRRHLSDTQREAIAAESVVLREAQELEAKLQLETATTDNGGVVTQENSPVFTSEETKVSEAAASLNVKKRNVRSAVNVVKKGSAGIRAAHKGGKITTSTAERLSKLEKKQQEKLAKATAKGLQQAAATLAKKENKSRGGLAADKSNANDGKSFKELALAGLQDLLKDTRINAPFIRWEEYHNRVISRLKAID